MNNKQIVEQPLSETIMLREASDEELSRISKKRVLSLSLQEMQVIRAFYSRQNREPTIIELETLAQTWSEHCKHKTLRGTMIVDGRTIDNLLASTIVRATREINAPWCVSVFTDNAGIISFDENHDIAFKVETHNHPSALEPYGGAGTGIGGVIRDILGVGRGAKPIANTDVFCFAPPCFPIAEVPPAVLYPRRVLEGVVAGVRDYGNRMGIPTVSGAVCFHRDFLCNPLVYCGTIGIMPKGMAEKNVCPGDLIVAIGGRTGRDGIHGATFSSLELDAESDVSAVQIGNAIEEKKLSVAILRARDEGLYRSITDCGAGGFSSAVGEMAEGHGAEVHLDRVPLKYAGLKPWEIWVSEAQERMVCAVPEENLERFTAICTEEDVELTSIGTFTDTGEIRLFFNNRMEGVLELNFLHHGLPRRTCHAHIRTAKQNHPTLPQENSLDTIFPQVLGMPDCASKEWIIRQYDHEVQAQTVLKPLQGARMDGPGDASCLKPLPDSWRGILVSHGINVHYGRINAYRMAACAIEEALRNIISAGGSLDHTALLDNFCWGDPDDTAMLGDLVQACEACYDYATQYKTPFISGKDSLNNTFRDVQTNRLVSIPPTLLISALSVIPDIRTVISSDFKKPGNLIYVIGKTFRELGGSQYFQWAGISGGTAPSVDPAVSVQTLRQLSASIARKHVMSCHDCSDGGIGSACAEMAIGGCLGAAIDIAAIPIEDGVQDAREIVFSESQSRFIVEVSPSIKEDFENDFSDIPVARIGVVNETKEFIITSGSETLL
ncbi:MAG: phosphoribosylformylglycinamidine synthase subunit PurL, partial [Elusimicrobia bacterium]|nr:phosphoribosylformylglycinamidine synthase subunit PurL [Elusimicrobiota bacterium]MBD3412472.1 phosphoribosylformylglycinamidine synthase subunit PurL [Elusimicrobiota bacterium]